MCFKRNLKLSNWKRCRKIKERIYQKINFKSKFASAASSKTILKSKFIQNGQMWKKWLKVRLG